MATFGILHVIRGWQWPPRRQLLFRGCVALLVGNVVLLPLLLDSVRRRGRHCGFLGAVVLLRGGGGLPGGQVAVRDVVRDPLLLRARLLPRPSSPLLGLNEEVLE